MGFRNGAFAMIWELENKGRYHEAKMSISKLNKESNEYEKEWNCSNVRLVGKAHEAASSFGEKTKVKIGNCDVTNKYDSEKKTTYTNYVIFSFEELEETASPASKPAPAAAISNGFMNIPDGIDEELPFN